MPRRRATTLEDLRTAIDCLPRATKLAMLEGIRGHEIIVGAYTRDGGICPMLAAHRCGGRTSFVSFARAWDRFAFRDGKKSARRATDRELLVLVSHLEASLLAEEAPAAELAAAIGEHRKLVEERRHGPGERAGSFPIRPGDPDRGPELRARPGWAWLRITRSYDEFERALRMVEDQREGLESGTPA